MKACVVTMALTVPSTSNPKVFKKAGSSVATKSFIHPKKHRKREYHEEIKSCHDHREFESSLGTIVKALHPLHKVNKCASYEYRFFSRTWRRTSASTKDLVRSSLSLRLFQESLVPDLLLLQLINRALEVTRQNVVRLEATFLLFGGW
jgi:hypothetical protein